MPEGKVKYAQARPPEAKELKMPAPELFVLSISHAFGQFPLELTKDNLERLEGMAVMWSDVTANPYAELIRAIRRYGNISIWMEHPPPAEEVREILVAEAEKRNMA
jgi:hypothetical protein